MSFQVNMILLGRMITNTNTSILDSRWILWYYRFSFKKFIHGISDYIGLNGLKLKNKLIKCVYYFFFIIWYTIIEVLFFLFFFEIFYYKEKKILEKYRRMRMRKKRKRRRKYGLLYFWASGVSCECVLGIIT